MLHVVFEVVREELHRDDQVGVLLHEPAVAAGEEVRARGLGEEQEEAQLVLDFVGSGGGFPVDVDLLLHDAGARAGGAGVEVLAEDDPDAASSDPLVANPDLVQRGVCDEHLLVGGGGDGRGELRVLEEFLAHRVGVETRKGDGYLGGFIGARITLVNLEVRHGDAIRMRKGPKRHIFGMLWLKDDGLSEAMFNDM